MGGSGTDERRYTFMGRNVKSWVGVTPLGSVRLS
jgi:hypothetical protein